MTKLPNRKGFTVSDPIEILIGGKPTSIANLLKPTSKAVHETIILISDGKIWHEINVLDHGGDTSDLEAFGQFVNVMNLSLSDFGIITDTEQPIEHFMDYIELAKIHKPHSYLDIEKLHKYLKKEGIPCDKKSIKEWLNIATKRSQTVSQLIDWFEHDKFLIINGDKPQNSETMSTKKTAPEDVQPPIEEVVNEIPKISASEAFGDELPVGPVGQTYIPDPNTEPETTTVEDFTNKVVSVTSLSTLGSFDISGIEELKGLKAETESILKKHPVIEVTDEATLATITKSINEVRKHCTALDGKNGVLENAKKFLNTLKSNIDLVVSDAVKPRRDLLTKLEANKTAYENEKIRIANEEAEKAKALISKELAEKDAEIEKLRNLLALAGMTTEAVEPSSNEDVELNPESTIKTTSAPPTPTYSLPAVEHLPLNRYDLENIQHLENPAFNKARVIFAKGCSYTADSILKILEDGGKSQAIKDFCAVLKKPIS